MSRTPSQVGAYSRRKGAAFERKIARLFADWTGYPCRRTPMSGAYGAEWNLAGDLMFSRGDHPWKSNSPPLLIELKRREGWTMDQIVARTGPFFDWWRKLGSEWRKATEVIYTQDQAWWKRTHPDDPYVPSSRTHHTPLIPMLIFKRNNGVIWVATVVQPPDPDRGTIFEGPPFVKLGPNLFIYPLQCLLNSPFTPFSNRARTGAKAMYWNWLHFCHVSDEVLGHPSATEE